MPSPTQTHIEERVSYPVDESRIQRDGHCKKSDNMTPALSIVSPVYRAEPLIPRLVAEIKAAVETLGVSYEIVLVDDASPDDSWAAIEREAAKDPEHIHGVQLSRNFGQHPTITAALSHARGEWIIVMDCDLQDNPVEIPRLWDAVHNREGGPWDGMFTARKNRQDTWFKKFQSRTFARVFNVFTGLQLESESMNYGIYHRRVVDAVLANDDRNRFFALLVRWSGFKLGTVDVAHQGRPEGSSAYTVMKGLRLAIGSIIGYSRGPLVAAIFAGVGMGVIAFCIAAYYGWLWWVEGFEVPGFASLIISIWLVGGLNLLFLGVVGIYVGEVFVQTKRRPHFLVRTQTPSRPD